MLFNDETQAKEKGRQAFIKSLSELEGDVGLIRTKVKRLITDYSKLQANASVELSSSMNKSVESHRKVLCSLHKASSSSLIDPLKTLDSLCLSKSGGLKSLTIAQNNISSILSIITPLADLPGTLAKYKQEMMNEDKLPFIISQTFKISEHRSRLLQKSDQEQKIVLDNFFKPLDDFEVYMNSYLWKTIENAVEVTKKDPTALAKIVRVIEKYEKNPKDQIKASLERGIERRLEWLLGTDKLNELADNTSTAISELHFMLAKVLPNFGEKYEFREFCLSNYRNRIEAAIEPHLSNLEKLRESPGLLVLIFQWINEYATEITKLCPGAVEELEIQILFAKCKELMPDFLSHMENLLSEWINRSLKAHISNSQILELASKNEPLSDTFPEEMFSAINQQLSFISNRLTGEVLIEVFRVCANRLQSQQKKMNLQIQELLNLSDPEIQIPSFCLGINNNQRAVKHCKDLQAFCSSKVSEEFHKERIENLFSSVQKGFVTLCNEGANAMAFCVISSISRDTVALLFTARWINERPVSMAFVTMEDYDCDIGKWLASDFYVRRYRKRFFEIMIQVYLEKMILAFKVVNNTHYECTLFQKFGKICEESLGKKEVNAMMTGTFRETVYRDKAEFMEYSNKYEIGFNCDSFFSGILRIREGGDLEPIISAIQGFFTGARELVCAVATVLTGKKYS